MTSPTIKPQWQPGQFILAPYEGKHPPTEQWVQDALDDNPVRTSFEIDGLSIELLIWGDEGKPGLLFLHGAGAQADWWNVIAPAFAKEYRVAAISWSGMGRSDWRPRYTIDNWGKEALKAIEVAGLDKAGKPMVIAHSLGGSPLFYLSANHSEQVHAGILVDSFIPKFKAGGSPPKREKLQRYATVEAALARYRFMPEQGTDYPEIVDYIARQSLRWVEEDGEDPAGWTWRFDPSMFASLDVSGVADLVPEAKIPLALIAGEQSGLVRNTNLASIRETLPNCPVAVAIPQARHHIMIDQPLALIAALRVTLQTLSASS
ncbi:alpha/beta fold hydrolase [Alteromonas lipolytica]|uniref:AB hydrolase-1 domain-containing protein n=1 Tax=Alteromonas lipolytica TaxID=1856405 RepID=A0A1E8FCM5_9ALTE|nr:alpha/beta hydrolase [Alteromonas lipolytica]OFI33516.1 hypothetical protein BFC17_04465 [Alteromonas lipolytica]GGF58980.1 alpha/beta hydrolase [Alteromonas lipolytica]